MQGFLLQVAVTLERRKPVSRENRAIAAKCPGRVPISRSASSRVSQRMRRFGSGNIRTRGNKDFCTLSMGAVSGDNPISLYQDDLVVATQRIGCK